MKIIEDGKKYIALDEDSKVMGEMTYSSAGENLWIIDHTHVNDDFRGQNVGGFLLDHTVEAARKKGVKIMPLCPYAKYQLEKYKDKYSDILY